MYNGGVRGTRGSDGAGMLSGRDQFTQTAKSYPSITSYNASNVNYTVLDDTAVIPGGYIIVNGSGFSTGMIVVLGTTTISSYTLLDNTRIFFTVPSIGYGAYNLYIFSSTGGGAILTNVLLSGFPTWTTGSYISQSATISTQLLAAGDAPLTYYLQNGSTLPSGVTLSTTGLLSGTISNPVSGNVYSFTVLVDDAQLQTTQQNVTLTLQFVDPYFNTTNLLLNGETSNTPFNTDASTNNYALTVNGAARPTLAHPYYNDGYYSTNFYRAGSEYVSIPNSTQLNFGTSTNFTIECWIYINNSSANGGFLNGQSNGVDFYINSSSYLAFGVATVLASPTPLVVDTVALLPGQWYHVAVARSGTSLKLFKNGAVVATATDSTAFTTDTANYIGYRFYSSSVYYFSGFVSNLRILNGTALYTVAFTPPTTPLTAITNTQLLTFQSSSLIDKSSNNFTITIRNGTPNISSGTPFNTPTSVIVNTGYSTYFNGSNAYLSTPSSTSFLFNADFTIEAWVYFTNIAGGSPQTWFSMGTGASTFDIRWFTTKWQISLNSGGGTDIGTTPAPVNNTWVHVAAVRLGSSINLYVNGVATATTLTNSSTLGSSSLVVNIGAGVGNGNKLTGYVSNLRAVKGLAVYTGTFTPPTSALSPTQSSGTNISAITTQTVLLTCQGNTFTDASTNAFTITQTGSPKVLNNAYPFTQTTTTVSNLNTIGSAYFNGTTDYLQLPTTATGLTTASGNFTCEFWTYTLTASATICYYASLGTNSGSYGFLTISKDSIGNLQFVSASNATTNDISISSSVAMPLAQWVHIAVVRYGNIYTLYQNGVSVATVTNATARYIAGTLHSIGAWVYSGVAYYLNGYISNFRFVNGTALYISNFAPTYSPLTAIANTQLLTLQNTGSVNNYNIIDNSIFSTDARRTGNPSLGTFSPYSPTGWSNYFNGSTDYLTTPASGSFLQNTFFGASKTFTVEAWLYQTAQNISGSYFSIVLGDASGASGINMNWCCGMDNANKPVIAWYDSTSKQALAANALSLNTWNHVAWIVTSGVTTIYINGVNQTLSGTTTLTNPIGSTAIVIGVDRARYYTGYISNLRAIYGTARYTTAFTPSTIPLTPTANTVLLTCQSNRFIDNSPTNSALTLAGTPKVHAFSPLGSISEPTPLSYSNYFDGSSDYLSIASNAAFAFGTGDFTIEFWTYINNTNRQDFIDIDNGGGYRLLIMYYSNAIGYYPANSLQITGPSLTLNTWYHIAVVRVSGSSKMYVNGTQVGSTYADTTNFLAQPAYIGHDHAGSTYVTGYISNLRIVKGTGVYTSAFTPSTTPLTAITNTVLLTCQSPTIVDNSTNNFTITAATAIVTPVKFNPFGYTTQTNTIYTPSIHGGSVYFDGVTLSHYKSDSLVSVINNDFTVDFWVYPTGTNASNINLFSMGTDGSSSTLSLYLNSGMIQNFVGGGATAQSGSTGVTVKPNAWNHYAIIRTVSNSYIYVYLNGVLTGYMAFGGGYPNSNVGGLSLGGPTYSGGTYTSGYISNFRVFNKVLYTSNFVPPTQLQTTATVAGVTYNPLYLFNFNNGGIVDAHSSNNLETVGGAQLSTIVKKFGTGSMSFSGSGQYLTWVAGQSTVFGTGDFTVEAWVYAISNSASTAMMVIDTRNSGQTTNWVFGIGMSSANGKFGWYTGTAAIEEPTTVASATTWYHIAYTRSGTTGRFFVNGTQVATGTDSTNYNVVPTISYIGGRYNQINYWNGYIDDLRITKGFARYTANFTTPTQAFLIQ